MNSASSVSLSPTTQRLAIGTAQFGLAYGIANQSGQVPIDDAKSILDLSQKSGIDTLDTAITYGDSESRLGSIGVRGWNVVSKLPAIPHGCTDVGQWVESTVAESLRRLRLDRLHGLLLHRPLQILEPRGDRLYRALLQLRDAGIVAKIGISIYDPMELDALLGSYPVDLVQAPFNLLDHRLLESGWLCRLADSGVELHTRSVFLQGLLLMPASARPKKFDRWTSVWSKWDQWLCETGITPLQACLGHALSFPEINKIVVGVDSADQLNALLAVSAGEAFAPSVDLAVSDLGLINPQNWGQLC